MFQSSYVTVVNSEMMRSPKQFPTLSLIIITPINNRIYTDLLISVRDASSNAFSADWVWNIASHTHRIEISWIKLKKWKLPVANDPIHMVWQVAFRIKGQWTVKASKFPPTFMNSHVKIKLWLDIVILGAIGTDEANPSLHISGVNILHVVLQL